VDLTKLVELANSETLFAVLFIAGLIYIALYVKGMLQSNKEDNHRRENQLIDIYKEQIDKGDKREEELMHYLDRNTYQLENISGTLEGVQTNLAKLDGRVEDNFTSVWKELNTKENKNNKEGDFNG